MSRMPMRRATLTLSTGLAALLLAGCEDERNAYVAPPPPPVTVAAPQARAVTNYIELTGTTAAINTVQLVARVEGFLREIHFQDGQRVKKDDLLFTIQQDQYQAELQQAQAEVRAIQAKLEQATTEFDRYSGLYKQKAASAVDVDHLACQPRRGAGRPAGRTGQGRACPAQSRLHHDHGTLRRPHGPPHGGCQQSGGHRRVRHRRWRRSTGSTRSTPTSRSTSAISCGSAANASDATPPDQGSDPSSSAPRPTRASPSRASWTSPRSH